MSASSGDNLAVKGESIAQSGGGKLFSIPCNALIDIDSKSDVIRGELVQVIVAWLIDQGLTSSAQLLRDEAATLFRQEHNERKTLRAISRAIHQGNWDAAQTQLKKLESIVKPNASGNSETLSKVALLLQSLPYLIVQEQFLEYIDEDDGQRAHVFFLRRIKPLEGTINREHFQQLIYMLTCHNVSEAGETFPIWRGWTPMKGRAQIQSLINRVIGYSDRSPYCRQYEFGFDGVSNASFKDLEQILVNSLSFELVKSLYPSLLTGHTKQTVHSIFRPLGEQLIPSSLILSLDMNKLRGDISLGSERAVRLTACHPFFQVPAIAAGTYTGSILWIPLENENGETTITSPGTYCSLYQYAAPVRGMTSHDRQILLSWSGCQAVVLNLARFMDKKLILSPSSEYLTDCVANTFTHTSDVYSSCLFPCGYILATGLSDGIVTVWDLLTGEKMYQLSFSSSPIESLIANQSGTCYFAASKEGLIRVVDVTTGVLLFTFASPVASEVSSVALSPSASLLLVSYGCGIIRLWDVLTGDVVPKRFEGIEGNTRRCSSVSFGCVDTHIISGHDDGSLYIWDSGSVRSDKQVVSGNQAITSKSQEGSPQNTPGLYTSTTPERYHWPVGEPILPSTRLRLHKSPISDVKFQHHYVVTCGDDGILCICSSVSKHLS
ncbi:WD40 repeat [Trypanosoma melophagium]|uniref:WD40 repeat n=1 Tax=Trypanosoma melophagium TaxID=715481 RepID=UPI00351A1830|nr:WD40 repeat [Trypanosoma melophagium]